MRTLRGLNITRDEDTVKFPEGTIQNETSTQDGTPVVREVYGDIITNIYKMLDRAGVLPSGSEDSETTQYQIIEALDLWANKTNDIVQVLSLTGTFSWSVNLPLSILPNKYVFIAMSDSDYVKEASLVPSTTFEGSEALPVYQYKPLDNYSAGDFLLVIVDQAQVVSINLTSGSATSAGGSSGFVGMGSPLAYSEEVAVEYETDGILASNKPSTVDVQAAIGVLAAEPDALILDMVHTNNVVINLVYLPLADEVHLYEFDSNNIATLIAVSGFNRIDLSNANTMYMYCDGLRFFFTNDFGESGTDRTIAGFLYNIDTKTMVFSSQNDLNPNFQKTTNAVVIDNFLHTFVDSALKKYTLTNSDELTLYVIPNLEGQIFKHQGKVMFSREEASTVWEI